MFPHVVGVCERRLAPSWLGLLKDYQESRTADNLDALVLPEVEEIFVLAHQVVSLGGDRGCYKDVVLRITRNGGNSGDIDHFGLAEEVNHRSQIKSGELAKFRFQLLTVKDFEHLVNNRLRDEQSIIGRSLKNTSAAIVVWVEQRADKDDSIEDDLKHASGEQP